MDTKDRILSAFNQLASHRDFDAITVFQIAQKAGVSRATFYRHFKDKYDVMNYNYSSLLEKHIEQGKITSMKDLFELLLEEGIRYWKPLLPLFRSEGANSLYTFIRDYSYDAARCLYEYHSLYAQDECMNHMSMKEEFQLHLFASGAAEIYEDWIRGKYPLSSKEAAQAMYEILPSFLKTEDFENMLSHMNR